MWGEQGLSQQTLVQVQANHVASSEEAHHHTQRIEAQVADGKVVCPPRADTDEKQEVDGWEGGGQSDAWQREEGEVRDTQMEL